MTDHLVILQPRWLANIVGGKKTVEFRASDRRIAPWGRVARGDRLWIKASGGPIAAVARVARVESRGPFSPAELDAFLGRLAGDSADSLDTEWRDRLTSQRYVTLSWTRDVREIPPVDVRDLRGRRQDSWQVITGDEAGLILARLPRGWREVLG